jgi:glycosyltransferase involved in cell wall biosynthesis
MKLEMEYGFRSCFNFAPEGDYQVSDPLRQELDQAGFEVGIYEPSHDGKLHTCKSKFAAKAAQIREYLRLWRACGFRSPTMHHRLAWLHELGVEYDASTFDTDPFDPKPGGVATVFPFWVQGPNGTGYVELPRTLPGDFTLFVALRERDIDVWKKKLDWIASRGGMALLNTHPDYMCFGERKGMWDEFPVSYYEEFLRYARGKYEGVFWSAIPREVSRFYCANLPLASRNSRKKICMLAYTGYESDNRVRRYAEALARRGDQVDVIALSGRKSPPGQEEIHGVTLHRVQRRGPAERYKWTYALRLLRFFWSSSIFLARRHHRIRYDVVHVHNIPDFLVFAAWYPKWTGARLILDIHDIVPELYVSKFNSKAGGFYARLFKMLEKASAAFVDHVIVSNHLWYGTLVSRSVPKEKCSVFLNHVDETIFYRRPRTRSDGKLIVIFPGTFQPHQGLDIAIKAFARFKGKVPNAEFHLYGGGGGADVKADLVRLADQHGVRESVKFCRGVRLEEIADVIANADLGVVPKRADSFGNEAYSTKIMEFMSQGVPVVASRTKIDTFYFDDTLVRFFESGDDRAMAEAMLEVVQNSGLREALVARGYEYVKQNSWDRRKGDYLALVDLLSAETFPGQEGRREVPLAASVSPAVEAGDPDGSSSQGRDAHKATRETHSKV